MGIRKMIVGAIAVVAFYNLFLYHSQPGVGIGFFFLAFNLYLFSIKNKDNKNFSLAIVCSTLSIAFAFLFSFRANGITQSINLAASVFFSLVAFYLYKQSQRFSLHIPSFLLLPFTAIKNSILTLIRFTNRENWPSQSENKDIVRSLLRGVFITIPILGILLFLFIQADPVFGTLTQKLLETLGERTIISIVLFTVLIVAGLTRIVTKLVQETQLKKITVGKAHELGIISGSIITLFTLFIVIQFRYLFSSVRERELQQLGIMSLTYSEYVRRGFFELLVTSIIASSVIVYVLRFLHQLKNRQKIMIQLFSGILTVETGLILLSAAKRVALYADTHGLTRARVFGFIFLIWLASLLLLFFIRIIREMRREHFFVAALFATLAALFSINFLNIDGLIATKYKPTVNNEIDYFYLASLSPDAYESWKPAIEDTEKIITYLESIDSISSEDNRKLYWTRETIDPLNFKIKYLVDKYGTVEQILIWHKNDRGGWVQKLQETKLEKDLPENLQNARKWPSWNMGEYSAFTVIVKDMAYFEQITDLVKRIYSLVRQVSPEVQRSTPIDRSTQPPLIRNKR